MSTSGGGGAKGGGTAAVALRASSGSKKSKISSAAANGAPARKPRLSSSSPSSSATSGVKMSRPKFKQSTKSTLKTSASARAAAAQLRTMGVRKVVKEKDGSKTFLSSGQPRSNRKKVTLTNTENGKVVIFDSKAAACQFMGGSKPNIYKAFAGENDSTHLCWRVSEQLIGRAGL